MNMALGISVTVRKMLIGGIFVVSALALTSASALADFRLAKSYFDAQSKADQLQEILQLIATGDFQGLWEFGFTHRLYNAVIAFQQREGMLVDGILAPPVQERLTRAAATFFVDVPTEHARIDPYGADLRVPRSLFDTVTDTPSKHSYERNDKTLSLSFESYTDAASSFERIFQRLSRSSPQRIVDYKKFHPGYFAINGTFNGRKFYSWMSRVAGGSVGFTLAWDSSWNEKAPKIATLMANTFVPENASQLPTSAQTDQSRKHADSSQQSPSQPETPKSATDGTIYSGTGFQVTAEGHVLTNYHVIAKCSVIVVKRGDDVPVVAAVAASDVKNDLAVIKPELKLASKAAVFRKGDPVRAGEDIVVFGYPKIDILSQTGNLVTGNVAALAGVGNDSTKYQISAPVQHGNSGGPVSDRSGHIIGVVVARLEQDSQDQNINFAIKSSIAETFLDAHNLQYLTSIDAKSLSTPEIGDLLREETLLILCK